MSDSIDRSRLTAQAEAATPGPWRGDDEPDVEDGVEFFTVLGGGEAGSMAEHQIAVVQTFVNRRAAEDTKFIAAASPDVVLALLAELAEKDAEITEWREQAFQETAEWGAETLSPIEDRLMEALQPRLDETDAAWVIQEHLMPLLKSIASFRKDDLTFYEANERMGTALAAALVVGDET